MFDTIFDCRYRSPSDDEAQHWQIEEVEQGRVTFTTVDSIGPFSLFNNGRTFLFYVYPEAVVLSK